MDSPLAGFAGKVFLLSAAMDGGMTWLAVIAAINMAIGLFYYVRVIAEMYFEAPLWGEPLIGGIGYATGLSACVGRNPGRRHRAAHGLGAAQPRPTAQVSRRLSHAATV